LPAILIRLFPFLGWFKKYNTTILRHDFISGLTVALVLIPQSMAYAQLAGLPAYYGLYAAFLPPMLAAMFGSSYQLATGPVAIVSLMTSTALAPLASAGSEAFIAYAILLALLVGIFQFMLGVLRLGLVVNLLSHPVVNGFTNAAALIIATSQLSKIFGVHVDSAEHHYQTVYAVIKAAIYYTHWPTLAIAALAFGIMIFIKWYNKRLPGVLIAVIITTVISYAIGFEHNEKVDIAQLRYPEAVTKIEKFNGHLNEIDSLTAARVYLNTELHQAEKTHEPHAIEVLNLKHEIDVVNLRIEALKENVCEYRSELRTVKFNATRDENGELIFYKHDEFPAGVTKEGATWQLKIGNNCLKENSLAFLGGGDVVGNIPQGLPGFKMPHTKMSDMLTLFPIAIIISLLGFMEAISIAKAMAAKTGQRLDPNQELIGQGIANIIGSTGQSYAVSGSFSRSAVNIQAGAQTGMSSVFSSAVVGLTLLFFTPLLYYLPQAVLAAIIMMAVIGLVNIRGFIYAWRAQWYDGAIGIITFVFTLMFAPDLEKGIMIGVALSLLLYLLRVMKPQIAMLSMHPDGTYRASRIHNLAKCKHVAVIRYNGSIFFTNVNYLEEKILQVIESMPELKHIIVVGNGINELDASGEDMVSLLVERVRESGIDISFSGLNDHVLDVMKRTYLLEKIGEDHIYRNATRAIESIIESAHRGSTEEHCPLREVVAAAPEEYKSRRKK
jgi:SulP family sulfate permease